MKKQVGIWIDSKEAVLVELEGGNESVWVVDGDIENKVYHIGEGDNGIMHGHTHITNEKKFEERKKHQIENYLDKVVQEISPMDEFYIFGPSEMKTHLKTKIESHKLLAGKLKGVEPADQMTLNQIKAQVRDFFLEHNNQKGF